MSLEEFLSRPRPWAWGLADCAMVLADWAVANGHTDPAALLRGLYDSEAGCRALLTKHGGLLPLVASCAEALALEELDTPEPGCVGVVGRRMQWGAIRGEGAWHVFTEKGFLALTARPLRMWRV